MMTKKEFKPGDMVLFPTGYRALSTNKNEIVMGMRLGVVKSVALRANREIDDVSVVITPIDKDLLPENEKEVTCLGCILMQLGDEQKAEYAVLVMRRIASDVVRMACRRDVKNESLEKISLDTLKITSLPGLNHRLGGENL